MPPRRNNNTNATPTPILPTHNQHLQTESQKAFSNRRHRHRRAVPWYRRSENVWRSRLETASHFGIFLAALLTLVYFLRRGDAEH
ncbi:hypothetical protein COCSADRAFT_238856 [Bipolaris sorokiniana ND90Pr]|uniref:Transmembrane protein n=1 Tax=Cochliobolus sativus (strain ND90Pr / ATCC 201652) TaxID=665912 RepID=M2R1B0_COCSN|nr:uncharacterized protein COCSADRAFT_238856 [Bipolaris sorokiniana ND90Pr]EMD61059.1 hypothetical protein COCSADRAFT_238856 [Bipolaris sorokiniana ND90Pr]